MRTKLFFLTLMTMLACLAAGAYGQFEEPGFPGDPGDPGTPPGMLGVSVIGPYGFTDMDMILNWDLSMGNMVAFNSFVTGQTGSLTYSWMVNESWFSSDSWIDLDVSGDAGTTLMVNLIVEDWFYGSMVSSGGAAFMVDVAAQLDPLGLAIYANGIAGGNGVTVDPTLGEGLDLMACGSGGDGYYSYGWDFNGGGINEYMPSFTMAAEDIMGYMNYSSMTELADAVAASNAGYLEFIFSATVNDGAGSGPVTSWLDVMIVPEPATMGLLALGGLAMLCRRRSV